MIDETHYQRLFGVCSISGKCVTAAGGSKSVSRHALYVFARNIRHYRPVSYIHIRRHTKGLLRLQAVVDVAVEQQLRLFVGEPKLMDSLAVINFETHSYALLRDLLVPYV